MEFEKAVMREEIETLSSALSARRSFQDYEELCKYFLLFVEMSLSSYQLELHLPVIVVLPTLASHPRSLGYELNVVTFNTNNVVKLNNAVFQMDFAFVELS